MNVHVELIHSRNSPLEPITYSIAFHFIILLKNSRCLQQLCSYAGRAVLSSSLIPDSSYGIPKRSTEARAEVSSKHIFCLSSLFSSQNHICQDWDSGQALVNTEASTLLCYAHGEMLGVSKSNTARCNLIFKWRTANIIFLHPL